MFDELSKYKLKNHFFFEPQQSLSKVCNAPADKSGVYIIYALTRGKIKLVYIGCSGKIDNSGKMFVRKAGLGVIKDRLVNGKQFGRTPRKISWPTQMLIGNYYALDIYWYVTHDDKCMDCPRKLENNLLKKHLDIYGYLPQWNKEL